MAQNTAIYSVFEPAVKKHPNFRCVQQHGRQKHCCLRVFLHFCAKSSSLGNVQKHCKNQCFCPTKTAKAVTQTAPKSQNLASRPLDKTHGKNMRLKTENRRPHVKKTQFFNFSLAGSRRARARTSPFRAVKAKNSVFWSPPS